MAKIWQKKLRYKVAAINEHHSISYSSGKLQALWKKKRKWYAVRMTVWKSNTSRQDFAQVVANSKNEVFSYFGHLAVAEMGDH